MNFVEFNEAPARRDILWTGNVQSNFGNDNTGETELKNGNYMMLL